MNLRDGYDAVLEAAAAAWVPPERLTVSQWADRTRILLAESSAEPGPWRTSRTPFWREVMDALSDFHAAAKISLMAASQMGKSECMNNWLGYTIDVSPCPFLLVEPTVDVAEKYSKQRIEPMIGASPALRAKVPSARKRDSGNTVLVKEFPGGLAVLVGANSPSGLASMPIKRAAFDETDRYKLEIGQQGSPIKQGEQRTITFPRGKIGHFSTPVLAPVENDDGEEEGGSHIWREFKKGSQARYHVPCPHCAHLQHLVFERLQWAKETLPNGKKRHLPETAVYMCEACGVGIEERYKPQMLRDAPGGGEARWVHEHPERTEHLSYHINALYSPIGLGRSWKEIVEEWLEACRDRAKLVTFFNLVLGLPFDDHADRLREQDLFETAEDYELQLVPAGYCVLTMAVDTQDDWLDVQVQAWGRGERTIVVDRFQLVGDPEKPAVWAELDNARHKLYAHAGGRQLGIAMTAVDTGGNHTQAVYRYCRAQRNDRVIGVKGDGYPHKPVLGRPSKQDVKNARGDVTPNGVRLWVVGTRAAKQVLFNRLAEWNLDIEPADRMVRMSKRLGADFYRQLTAEVWDKRSDRFVQLRKRNESIDLAVYNLAASCHPSVRVDRMLASEWDRIEAWLATPPDAPAPERQARPGAALDLAPDVVDDAYDDADKPATPAPPRLSPAAALITGRRTVTVADDPYLS